ncbi:MAG: hypothetical protein AAF787_21985, partial [Chloroflexota bacterium]
KQQSPDLPAHISNPRVSWDRIDQWGNESFCVDVDRDMYPQVIVDPFNDLWGVVTISANGIDRSLTHCMARDNVSLCVDHPMQQSDYLIEFTTTYRNGEKTTDEWIFDTSEYR